MKKAIKAFVLPALAGFIALVAAGCNKDNNGGGGGQQEGTILFENGTQIGDGRQDFDFKGKASIKKGTYILKGWVYVTNGSELTIEPGTIIKGDKETKAALIVEPGGKLFAEGTENQPIVFTSEMAKGERRPGDWGGLIICGLAKNNKSLMTIEGGPRTSHAGAYDDDNSGVIRYVRVEFAGYPFRTDQEINGITFGSVGSATKIDHLQVSYSNDDSYEWFGGTVNAKYLVAYNGWDDDFDTDNGFSGKLQFLLSVRNPKIADTSLSNSFESDNNAEGTDLSPFTSPVFSNVTIIGPVGQDPSFENTSGYINAGNMNPQNGSKTGIFQSAMQIRRNSRLNCFNSVAMGFPVGLLLDDDKRTVNNSTHTSAQNGDLVLKNIYFAGMGILGCDINKMVATGALDQLSTDGKTVTDASQESFSWSYFKKAGLDNVNLAAIADLKLAQPNSLQANANYGPSAGSPLTGKSNLFTDAKVNIAFFDKVNYIGAFASDSEADNWLRGWTNFDPQNTDY